MSSSPCRLSYLCIYCDKIPYVSGDPIGDIPWYEDRLCLHTKLALEDIEYRVFECLASEYKFRYMNLYDIYSDLKDDVGWFGRYIDSSDFIFNIINNERILI